jgi:ADP-ribose pyrophosphatase YjhB (NUDIX family)
MQRADARRRRCDSCGFTLNRNPLPGVAAVISEQGRILLARRRSSVFPGMWCIPCGYVEVDEDIRDAARRECREETGLEVDVGDVIHVASNFQLPYRSVIGVWFEADVRGGVLAPGDDVSELQSFPLDHPPDLAFEGDQFVIARLAART